MSSKQLDEEAIFHVAREITNPEARERYLVQVCADDELLRKRIEALLAAHAPYIPHIPEAKSR